MTLTLLNNRYRVLQMLGSGGFGNTFLAEDTYMPSARRCVIKQLKPVTHDPQAYKLVQERFQREAAVLEELGEGNTQIPRLYAYFQEAGQFYLVQEYIEGDTLTKRVEQRGRLAENEVKQILVSLLPVLDYVHSRRMIHRDIKPDNIIMRKQDGLPVLIDFGAVKEAMNTVVNSSNSAPSIVIGTSGFMPAEQAGGRPTFASDLYSLGMTAVFLLTGKMPQELQTDARTGELLWRQYAPNINSNLAMVIDRTIRFNVGDRFVSAKDMLNALQSAGTPSDVATQVVSPGGLPHPGNGSTTPTANHSPRQTVPAGTPPVITTNERHPFVVGGLIAAGLVLGAIALAVGLTRSPQRSSPVSSSSDPAREQTSPEQPSATTPSRSQPTYSEPTREQPTPEQPSATIPSPSRRSPRSESTRSPLPPESSSGKSTQAPEKTPAQSSPPQPIPVPSPTVEDNNQDSNQRRRIPGFPPGTQQSYIRERLGQPTKTTRGRWNTRAVTYEDFVPGQVSFGYLYDPSSGRLRETEASFADSVELRTMSRTLNQMLNGNSSRDIRQGLEAVYQGKSNRYTFVSGRDNNLKGVIERNEPGHIYIAVWEADLH